MCQLLDWLISIMILPLILYSLVYSKKESLCTQQKLKNSMIIPYLFALCWKGYNIWTTCNQNLHKQQYKLEKNLKLDLIVKEFG